MGAGVTLKRAFPQPLKPLMPFQSHLLASCRSSLDLVTHYHERVRSHPTKGHRGQRSKAKGGQRSRAPSYAEVAAFGERVAGARARLDRLAEVVRRSRAAGSRSEDEER